MRRVASAPSFSIVPPERKAIWEGEIHVVTPMFGGSATAGQVDPGRPVNAKMVRGHLRFWWRACRAAQFESAKDLFDAEAALWGSTETPSALDLVLEVRSSGNSRACARYEKRPDGTYKSLPAFASGYPPYALFPFQGKAERTTIQIQPAEALEGVRFSLRILPSQSIRSDALDGVADGVLAALWAWLLFGGVGARTRRGCGSLYTNGWPFEGLQANALEAISKLKSEFLHSGARSLPIPALCGAGLLVGTQLQGHLDAWSAAVNTMRDFRQSVGFARNRGQQHNRPGRSRWPEADSIREYAHVAAPGHRPSHPARPFFPRADLGMPIVFHFQSREDPSDYIVGPKEDGKQRMASPIILKPLAVSVKAAYPIALLLNAPHVWDREAPKPYANNKPLGHSELADGSKVAKVPPLTDMGNKNARDAFMAFFKQKTNAKEVKL
ncbi:MAG: hypothetical protein AMXMBFR61_08300 [Fimbriimonadales bacterium]